MEGWSWTLIQEHPVDRATLGGIPANAIPSQPICPSPEGNPHLTGLGFGTGGYIPHWWEEPRMILGLKDVWTESLESRGRTGEGF